jgi:hypothetical protein
MIGSLVGTLLARATHPPEGLLPGPGVEETLARASFHLEQGRLREAWDELNSLEGYTRTLATDWIDLAEQRLTVEMLAKALRANNVLNHLAVHTS